MSRQLSWQKMVKPVALVVAYFACLAGMVYLMDRVETARAEARVIGWTQSLVWESLDAPAYARFTQPIVEPAKGTGWNLTGEIRVPDQSGTFVAQPYQAKVRIVCSPSRNRECWELTGLSVGDVELSAAPPSVIGDPAADAAAASPDDTIVPDQTNFSESSSADRVAAEPAIPSQDAQEPQPVEETAAPAAAPPQTAVDILEARLTGMTTEPAGEPDTATSTGGADPFDETAYRHAGLDDLDTGPEFASERLETIAAGPETVPDGYPPIPTRKPL